MSAPEVMALRLFGGPHLGAELRLPAGSFCMGSDDSCDFILQDSTVAARHMRIDIQVSEEGLTVFIVPLDSRVQTADGDVPSAGMRLPEEQPCQLGLSVFAWARPDALPEAWLRVQQAVTAGSVRPALAAGATSVAGDASAPVEASAPEASEASDTSEASVIDLDQVVAPAANTVGEVPPSPVFSAQRYLLLGVGLLCLCGLIFSYVGRPDSPERRVEQVQSALYAGGFAQLRALPMGQGVSVIGIVRHDGERVTLLKLAQKMQFPVYLDLVVQGDRAEALRSAFNSRGFFPDVEEENGVLKVSGYTKDALVEEGAFSAVRGDIPELREDAVWARLERVIRYAKDVEPVLKRVLAEHDLASVGIRFLSGQVELAGVFDADQHARLSQVLETVRLELGVPVLFSVVPSFAQADARRALGGGGQRNAVFGGSAVSPGQPRGASAPETSLDSLQVTGVTLSPMRFIALSNGQRIFEGGLLPGGYTLEKIDVNSLTLRKDGQAVSYPLRGTHE